MCPSPEMELMQCETGDAQNWLGQYTAEMMA